MAKEYGLIHLVMNGLHMKQILVIKNGLKKQTYKPIYLKIMKLINRILNETTCEGKTLDIYIKPANDTDMDEWKKKGIYQYVVVFHFNNVPNKNYGHSYYIDTIMDSSRNRGGEGLCLNGGRWNYESMDKKSMDNVRNFIQEFVEVNGLNLHKECAA